MKLLFSGKVNFSYEQLRISDSSPNMETWPEWQGGVDPAQQIASSLDTVLLVVASEYVISTVNIHLYVGNNKRDSMPIPPCFTAWAGMPMQFDSQKIDIGDVVDFGEHIFSLEEKSYTMFLYSSPDLQERDEVFICLTKLFN